MLLKGAVMKNNTDQLQYACFKIFVISIMGRKIRCWSRYFSTPFPFADTLKRKQGSQCNL